jgi:hypothetical protein
MIRGQHPVQSARLILGLTARNGTTPPLFIQGLHTINIY